MKLKIIILELLKVCSNQICDIQDLRSESGT